MASSSSSCNWVYDVFPSFSGEDVRTTFLSHFLKELDRKLIIAFKDNEMERSHSLDPELKKAIRTSRLAVVVFSEKYPSSSWCLDELVEIVKCKKELGQLVIPIFYGLDPSHVRKQIGKFGETFSKTCQRKTENETQLWRQSLIDVADVLGYHSHNWPNEAKMIEAISNDVLAKLNINSSKEFEEFVGMEDHIAELSILLHLESEEVRMVGIWGSSGIGKTTIARILYSKLSRQFQGSVYIDRAFVSKSMDIYTSANPDDYNMKLHLLRSFLSEMLNKKDIKIDRLDAVEERLKHHKVLIFIDDLDDQVVLDTLNHCDYKRQTFPSKEHALEMFCRSAFKQNNPPEGMMELASEVALRAGNLPLGLKVLGSYLRGRSKEDWIDMLPSLRNRLNGKIAKTLRVSYDGLNNRKDEKIFRHIACLFNGVKINDIKLLLADSDLDVNVGLKNLADKSLIHVREDIVEMHCLLEDMGKEIVREQSNEPGEREFLMDSKDICDLLEDNNGTRKVLGISLDLSEVDELHIHENAFKGMRNLLFLNIHTKKWDHYKKEMRWDLPEGFNYLPHKLRLLRFDRYPMRAMPANFRPENLVNLQMAGSKLERLWEGVHSLRGLKNLDLRTSISLKELPDLSMATNLETLDLSECESLVELPSSIRYLNKLENLNMIGCINLETFPTGINLQSLNKLYLLGCSKLRSFPDISTKLSLLIITDSRMEEFPSNLRFENLRILSIRKMKSEKLWPKVQTLSPLTSMLPHSLTRLTLTGIPNLVELPFSIQRFSSLDHLEITDCINLETLPIGINFPSLSKIDFTGCSRLKIFPDISNNISQLWLRRTGIQEVPWWIENFSKLTHIHMTGCNSLKRVSMHISKLKHLHVANFADCGALAVANWNDIDSSSVVDIDDASSSFPENFISCFNFDLLRPESTSINKYLMLPGKDMPSCFTHRTTGTLLANIPLLHISPTQQPFLRLKVDSGNTLTPHIDIDVHLVDLGRVHTFLHSTALSLAELNYDHVNVRLQISNYYISTSKVKVKAWGIRFLKDYCSSSEKKRFGNPNSFPRVCETDKDNETECSEEATDSNVGKEGSNKRIRLT